METFPRRLLSRSKWLLMSVWGAHCSTVQHFPLWITLSSSSTFAGRRCDWDQPDKRRKVVAPNPIALCVRQIEYWDPHKEYGRFFSAFEGVQTREKYVKTCLPSMMMMMMEKCRCCWQRHGQFDPVIVDWAITWMKCERDTRFAANSL